jgi:hypothetical protein
LVRQLTLGGRSWRSCWWVGGLRNATAAAALVADAEIDVDV